MRFEEDLAGDRGSLGRVVVVVVLVVALRVGEGSGVRSPERLF